jgi:glycine/D-amino acid oxidase-like deaminating enzyme
VGLTELSNLLWRQRQLLDLLQFKLDEECLLLETGHDRWLAHATREVELVLDEISRVEMARALELAAVAPELGLSVQPTLADLAPAVPAPWDALFHDHRAALRLAVEEVVDAASRLRPLLVRGRENTVAALRALVEESTEQERVG